jgi:hypothetical protein
VQKSHLEIIQTVAQVASVLVATVAIIYAVDANKQSQLVFQEQLKQSERLAAASMAPFLYTRRSSLVNGEGETCSVEVSLENTGEGTALIEKFFALSEFGDEMKSIPEAMDQDISGYVSRYSFIGSGQYLPANGRLVLVRISAHEIAAASHISIDQALVIVREFEEDLSGVVLDIEYSDVLKTQSRTMTSSFNRDRGRVMRTLNGTCETSRDA